MDSRLLIIPVAFVFIGIIVMVVLNIKGKSSKGVAQNVMKEFVKNQLPAMQIADMKVINILEDAINAQHIWVVAYNSEGMFLIPAISNPLTRSIKRYEDLTPAFNLKKKIASNMFSGNKSEEIEYIPYSTITDIVIDSKKNKIKIDIEDVSKSFKYQSKDCFGADQQEDLNEFLTQLKGSLE